MENRALYERFEELLAEFNTTPYGVSKRANVSQPTLSDWKLGKSEPKRKTLEKICSAYGKNISYFYGEKATTLKDGSLNVRDKRDIKKSVDEIMESLDRDNGETLRYDGVEVTLSEENRELIRHALTLAMQAVKLENKEKFNPHKNGK